MPTAVLAVAVVASSAASIASSQSAKKAAERNQAATEEAAKDRTKSLDKILEEGLLEAPEEIQFDPITPTEVRATAQNALNISRDALPTLNEMARLSNEQNTKDLESSLEQLSGGAFGEARDKTFDNVISQLEGRLSEGTRQLLAREAVGRGITELGQGAVDRAYTGFLGLQSEQLSQQGVSNFQGLTSLMGQLAPRESGANLLKSGFGGLTTQNALAIEQFNSQGAYQAAAFNAGYDWTARVAQADAILNNANINTAANLQAQIAANNASAAADAQTYQAIASGISSLAGSYYGLQQSQAGFDMASIYGAGGVPVDQRSTTGIPTYNAFTGKVGVDYASNILANSGINPQMEIAQNPYQVQQANAFLRGTRTGL